MTNRILVIYENLKEKESFKLCEKAVRALFKRFRKSVSFSYISSDIFSLKNSLSLLENENADAIVCCMHAENKNTISKSIGAFIRIHDISGHKVIVPFMGINFEAGEKALSGSFCLERETLEKAICEAISLSETGTREILVCTSPLFPSANNFLFDIYEDTLKNHPSITSSRITLPEVLWGGVNLSGVTLTDTYSEENVVLGLYKRQLQKTEYLLVKGDRLRFYCPERLPDDEIGNLRLSLMLSMFAGLIENELGLKNLSDWLKRAIVLALLKSPLSSSEEFIGSVIEITNQKIRQRQADKDDYKG